MDPGQRQRQPRQPVGDVAPLGLRLLQELAPRRHHGEQVGDLDPGALGCRHLPFALDRSRVQEDLVARSPVVAAAQTRAQPSARDRGDGRQRLAAEAEARDPLQVLRRRELAGGVSLERQVSVSRRHPDSVIRHGDQPEATLAHVHADPAGIRIERVLDQLLDDRGRPLDHLARRDLVDHGVGKHPDARLLPA